MPPNQHPNVVTRHEVGYSPGLHGLSHHEPMLVEEFHRSMRKMGAYSHRQMGDLIGVDRSTISIWLLKKKPIPKPVAMLLRLMVMEKNRAPGT